MKKKLTQLRWLVTMFLLVTAMAMPKMAWAETYDNNGFAEGGSYQPATRTTDQYDINGDGTKDEVYEIGNAGQLYWFAGLVNGDASVCNYDENTNPTGTKQNKAACAVLTANIVVNSGLEEGKTMLGSLEYDTSGNVTNGSNFVAWTPIGFNYQNYIGTFDGKGYTVSGLYFNDTSKEKVGLFGRVDSGGKISNVGVLDSYFQFRMQGGGICGLNYGEINNCTNDGTVIGNSTGSGAGGVCGMNYGTVKDCKNTGSVSGTVSKIGGVCGAFYSGSIENCLNEGTVSGTGNTTSNSSYGGVCGYAEGGVIKLSSNTASIRGYNAVGGVCGSNTGATLEDCYNTGAVIGTALSSFGGVCGSNTSSSTIKNCYNTGAVSGKTFVGGVCGNNSGTITNCYYLASNDDGNGGKTTDQFKSGEVAYLLSQGSTVSDGENTTYYSGSVWGQQLGTDDYPVLGDYKVIKAAEGDNKTYWATFSNQSSDMDLSDLTVYTAKVSEGILTLTPCKDNIVAKGEGVLVKGNSEYLNALMLNYDTETPEANNDLVATPAEPTVITADDGSKLYRLTYNNVSTKTGLGFYLGIVGESKNGSQLKATPGKAYLNVSTEAATTPATAALARSFVFPGDDETTGIGEIVIDGDAGISGSANADGRIYNLQGQQVTAPVKGLYIKNNKKVIIK